MRAGGESEFEEHPVSGRAAAVACQAECVNLCQAAVRADGNVRLPDGLDVEQVGLSRCGPEPVDSAAGSVRQAAVAEVV